MESKESNLLYWPLEMLTDHVIDLELSVESEARKLTIAFMNTFRKEPDLQTEMRTLTLSFLDLYGQMQSLWKAQRELILPYILQICEHRHLGANVKVPQFGSLSRVLAFQEGEEHHIMGSFHQILFRLNLILVPERLAALGEHLACDLREFENSLHALRLVKYQILFPKAIEIENMVERVL